MMPKESRPVTHPMTRTKSEGPLMILKDYRNIKGIERLYKTAFSDDLPFRYL